MPRAENGLYYEQGGSGEPLVILMHGLSCTGAVFRAVADILDKQWPGRWIAPDFRGHGRSPHADRYGIALHAADIAGLLDQSENVYLLGHSMGGQCAMALASGWFGFLPKVVVTFGVAVDWGNEAKARIDKLVHTPVRYFATELEARERFVLVNGLKGYIDPASDIAASGVRQENGQWRLAADNRAAMVASASTRKCYSAAEAPIVLARGANDPMVSEAEHKSLDAASVAVAGCGHNVHVENPAAAWELLRNAADL